jgi:uncharacterized membrane protein
MERAGSWRAASIVLIASAILVLCVAVQPATAARITGTAYTADLQIARYTMLTIDSQPEQRIILDTGTYDVTLGNGTYTFSASITTDGTQLQDSVVVVATDDGTYTYDLILFPAEGGEQEEMTTDDLTIPELTTQESDAQDASPQDTGSDTTTSAQASVQTSVVVATLLIIALVIAAITLGKRRWWERGQTQRAEQQEKPTRTGAQHPQTSTASPTASKAMQNDELPDDLAALVAAIRREGGRTTQKELRKHVACSEAKLSMMLTELESRGLVRKIKKGRANVVALR